MIHGFEGYSNVSEMLTKIYEAHWESGNEAGSRMGLLVKSSLDKALKSQQTIYTTKVVKGKRRIIKTISHSFGQRIDRKTGKVMNTPNMANFIQWRTYSSTGTTVIGGLMKSGYTEIRRNGKVVEKSKVFSVNQSSVDILEKMDSGKIGHALWNTKNGGYSPLSKGQFVGTHKPTNFISEAKTEAFSGVDEKMTKWMEEALRNRDDIKQSDMRKM